MTKSNCESNGCCKKCCYKCKCCMNDCCKKGYITAEPLKANIIFIGYDKLVIDEDGVTIVNAKIKIK